MATERTRGDIIAKVQKLLNLADKNRGATDAEAAQALLIAQRYMAEYDIEMADVEDMPKEEIEKVGCNHIDNLGYRCKLATVIAKNFKCKTYMQGNTVMFYGFKSDTQLAKEAFEFAYRYIYRVGNRHCEAIRRQGYSAKGVFNSYAIGFISGIEIAFEKQCQALVVVVPQEVRDSYEDMAAGWGQYRGGMSKQQTVYREYYNEGQRDGKEAFGKKHLQEA